MIIADDYYDRLRPERTAQRLTQRLERIGYEVVLTAPTPASAPPPKAGRKRGRPLLAPSVYCSRCAKWGIACIHARNVQAPPNAPSSTESTG
jgi:hypothetical protein